MPFTWTEDPHLYGLEMALSNILMIWLFRSQQTCKGIYIYDVHMEGRWLHIVS